MVMHLHLLDGLLWRCAFYEQLPPVSLSHHTHRNALALKHRRSAGFPGAVIRGCARWLCRLATALGGHAPILSGWHDGRDAQPPTPLGDRPVTARWCGVMPAVPGLQYEICAISGRRAFHKPSRTSPRAAKSAKYLKTLALATGYLLNAFQRPPPAAARRERNTATAVSVTTPARARPSASDRLARAASVGRYLHLPERPATLGPRGHLNGRSQFPPGLAGAAMRSIRDSFIPQTPVTSH
jgi:hypothetical protein